MELSAPELSYDYKDHEQRLSNLEPGTEYIFKIISSEKGALEPTYSQEYGFKSLSETAVVCVGNIYVSATGGNDSNTGLSRPDAKRSISSALQVAQSGHTVCVASGEYRERITVGKAVKLQGEPGAIIDGADRFSSGWTLVDSTYGIYRRHLGYQRGYDELGTYNNSYLIKISNERVDNPNFNFMNVLRNGPSLGLNSCCLGTQGAAQSWDGLKGLFAVTSDGTFYVKTKDLANPNGGDFSFAPYESTAVTINADSATVSGFTIRGGYYAIRVFASSVSIFSNRFYHGRNSIIIQGSNNSITNNYFTLNFGHTLKASHAMHWRIWNAFRNLGADVRDSIHLNSGSGTVIARNHFHEAFSAIEVGTATLPNGAANNTIIESNVFENLANDAILIGSTMGGSKITNNRITDVNNAIRFGFYIQGPIHISRNTMYMADSATAENMCFYFHGPSRASLLIHHNSCMAAYGIVIGGSTNPVSSGRDIAPIVVNNIFSTPTLITSWGSLGAIGTWDYNYYSSSGKRGANDIAGGGERLWPLGSEPDFLIRSSQLPFQKGFDVTVTNGSFQTPYLNFQTGYFPGPKPTIGAKP